MNAKLLLKASARVLAGAAILMLLLFLPAGDLRYMQAWLFLGVLFIPMLIAGGILAVKKPQLLKKRLNAKEKESQQKAVILFSALMFLAAFLSAGFSYRFQFFMLPTWCSFIAAAVFLAAYAIYAGVLRENEYLSRTVEVQEGQQVVDTGLYGVVRHPMYLSTVLLFLSMPLVLGSLLSFAVTLFYIPLIVLRIRNEEKVLEEGLEGYAAYKKKVRYRLIPFIW